MKRFVLALLLALAPVGALAQTPVMVFGSGSTPSVTSNINSFTATSTITLQIAGTQWATAQVVVNSASTSTYSIQISDDGGANYYTSLYSRRITGTFTAADLTATSTVTGEVWEIPLPGDATHVRAVGVAGGATSNLTLRGGRIFVPGVPVVALAYYVTSAVGGASAFTLVTSGWTDASGVFCPSGTTSTTATVNEVDEGGSTINGTGSFSLAMTATTCVGVYYGSDLVAPMVSSGGFYNIALGFLPSRRQKWAATTATGQTMKLRVQVRR